MVWHCILYSLYSSNNIYNWYAAAPERKTFVRQQKREISHTDKNTHPHAPYSKQYYSSRTTTEAARTAAPDPPTHPPKDPRCTAAAQQGRTAAVREFEHADVIIFLHRIGIL